MLRTFSEAISTLCPNPFAHQESACPCPSPQVARDRERRGRSHRKSSVPQFNFNGARVYAMHGPMNIPQFSQAIGYSPQIMVVENHRGRTARSGCHVAAYWPPRLEWLTKESAPRSCAPSRRLPTQPCRQCRDPLTRTGSSHSDARTRIPDAAPDSCGASSPGSCATQRACRRRECSRRRAGPSPGDWCCERRPVRSCWICA